MAIRKNTAGQVLRLYAYTPADGLPATGDAANISCLLEQDGGIQTGLGGATAELSNGYYEIPLAQAESNADDLFFLPSSITAGVLVVVAGPYSGATLPVRVGDLLIGPLGLAQVDMLRVMGSLLQEDTLGRLAANFSFLFNNADAVSTTRTLDALALEASLGGGGTDPMVELETTLASVSTAAVMTLTDGPTGDDQLAGKTLIVQTGGASEDCIIASYVGATKQVTLLKPLPITPAPGDPAVIRLLPAAPMLEDEFGEAGGGTTTTALVLDSRDPNFSLPQYYLGAKVVAYSATGQSASRIVTGSGANSVTWDEATPFTAASYLIRQARRANVDSLLRESSDAVAIAGSKTGADNLAAGAEAAVLGSVTSGTLTTTAFSTDLGETNPDQYVGRVVIFKSGTLVDQQAEITAYDGGGLLTVKEMTGPPSAGDTFIIL